MAGNLLTLVRDLQRRKARERRGLILAEGRRLALDAFESGARIRGVLISDAVSGPDEIARAAARHGIAVEQVAKDEFARLADTETPSGVLAVVEWEPLTPATLPPAGGPLLVIDGVQDPGNVGTMIRTAFALGARATVALDGTADVRGPRVVRGAMGALFRHPVAVAHFDEFAAWAAQQAVAVLVAAPDGDPVRQSAGPGAALVVGSEGHGVRPAWAHVAGARRVAIPMTRGAESLNAAVAAGILLYELTR